MAATHVVSTPSNVRTVGLFGGQLYGAAANGMFFGLFQAGTGAPTTENVTATLLPGMASTTGPSPYGFTLLDRDPMVPGLDTAYIADDRSPAMGGGVQRWTRAGSTWTLSTTFSMGLMQGVRGLTAWVEGDGVTVAAVTAESPTRVVRFRDAPGAPPAATALLTAADNTALRGVALAPTP
jgi:hypothetical protein